MPPPNQKKKILLHGSGAIGSIYLYLLHAAAHDVTAVCRSNYSAASTDGFHLDSARYGQDIHFRPRVVRTPGEATEFGPYDFVIVATKALPEAKTWEVLAPVVGKGTTVVLVQNGVGIEGEFARAFPQNPLVSCVVYLPTTQIRPGHVEMGDVEMLEVGSFPASAYAGNSDVKTATDSFVEMMKDAGSNVTRYEDVQEKRWKKLLLNAPWNPICALTLSRDVAFLSAYSGADKLIEAVMLEVVTLAQKLGYPSITADAAREQLERARERVGGKGIEPSMLVDIVNGRRMEVEVILGNPVRMAKELGVEVPRLEVLYGLAKALDEAVAYRRPGESLGGDETRTERMKNGLDI